MSSIFTKLSPFYEKHPWVYRTVSWSFAILLTLSLIFAFMFLTPADFLRAGRDVRPPELQAYSQYRDIFLSFGIFIFLFIFLTITLLGPLYLQNKPVMDAFINHSKQQLGSFIESSRNIRAFLWLALCIWVLTWGIVTLRLLFAAYPPDMIETIRHIYGDPSAEHFKNSAQNLFYHFLIIGSILTFTPVFLVFCYRLRAKGTD